MRCPKCNSANTLEIFFSAYSNKLLASAKVQSKKLIPKVSRVNAQACVSCGNIFDLKLENPETLAPFAGNGYGN